MWVAHNFDLPPVTKGSDLPVYNTATKASRMGVVVGDVVSGRAPVNVGGCVVYVRVS